jgi:CubicO group peptidase (beta-lactamase class C family)
VNITRTRKVLKLSCVSLILTMFTTLDLATCQIGQSTADHIHAVESSLSTGIVISGHPLPTMNLTDRMRYHRVPASSVAVIHQGRIEWARGYGVQQTDGASVTADTLFSAASISKAITALAVLRLAQNRAIDLDANVNLYLKAWKIPENEFTKQRPVTPRELLNHTSGIGESLGMIYTPSTKPTVIQMLNGEPPATNAPVRVRTLPGNNFEYSNTGFLVLAALITDVTGKPFAEAMHDLVLSPLDMIHSTFEQPLPLDYAKHAASAFGGNATKGMAPENFVQANQAAGGLWTTPTDLAKAVLEIEDAYAGRHSRLLTQKTARMMLTPGMGFPALGQGKVFAGAEHWGLGIELGGKPNHPFLDHGGAAIYDSFLFSYLDGEGIIVMTNNSRGFHINQELLASAASVYNWPDFRIEERVLIPTDQKDLDQFVGTYGNFIRVTKLDDGLQCEVLNEGKQMRMYASSKNRFFVLDASDEFEFNSSDRADSTELRFITPTFSFSLPRSN